MTTTATPDLVPFSLAQLVGAWGLSVLVVPSLWLATCVTAAATGAIAGAAFILARRGIFDVATAVVAVVTLAALLKLRRVPEPALILAAGLVGVVLKAAGG